MMRFAVLLILLIGFSAAPVTAEFPEISGWIPSGESESFGPSNLWEYINGAADQFLAFGFQGLETSEISQGGVSMTVDMYDMGSCLNAFGIFRLERSDDAEMVRIGVVAAVSPPYQWLMFKDRFYVKVEALEGDLKPAGGLDLLEKIAATLPGTNELPDEFKLLPRLFQLPGTLDYTRRAFLGLKELRNCLHAIYSTSDKRKLQYFYIVPDAKETKSAIWTRLSAKWKADKLGDRPVLLKAIPYKGIIGVINTSHGILGAAGCEDKAELMDVLKSFPQ